MSILTSINFLFLTSLGVTSWIILCYFHKIEQQKLDDFTADYHHMERVYVDEAIINATVRQCPQSNDFFLNCIGIFACLYGICKITSFTQNYIGRRLHTKYAYGLHGAKLQNLMLKVDCLEKQNKILEFRLEALQQTKLQEHLACNGDNADAASLVVAPVEQRPIVNTTNTQNVYILNRQVFINEGNMKLHIHSKDNPKDTAHIWRKYLAMQQMAIYGNEPPDSAPLKTHDSYAPAIMSLNELECNNEDLYKCL